MYLNEERLFYAMPNSQAVDKNVDFRITKLIFLMSKHLPISLKSQPEFHEDGDEW